MSDLTGSAATPPPLQISTAPTRSSSILEDASTLLMFHNSAVTATEISTKPLAINNQESTDLSSASPLSHPLSPPVDISPNLSSPGPAIAALAGFSTANQGYMAKGKVAADALTAAIELTTQRATQKPPQLLPPLLQTLQLESQANEAVKDGFEIESRADSNQTVEEDAQSQDEDKTDINDEDIFEEKKVIPNEPSSELELSQSNKEFSPITSTKTNKDKRPRRPVTEPSNPQAEAVLTQSFSKRLSEYKVDPDSGIISCICEVEEDDGYTIQCDKCFRWQHIYCMGIVSIEDAPDDFLCNACQPRPLNVKRARSHQLQRVNFIRKRKERRGKQQSTDDDEEDLDPSDTRVSKDSKDQKDDESKNRESTKPTRQPKPLNPYGKNLEEGDIKVLAPRDQYKTTYFHLSDYDYDDLKVSSYIKNTMKLGPNSICMTKSEYKLTNFPSLKVKQYSDASNKKFNGITRTALYTEDWIPQNTLIGEYLGVVGFKNNYMQDSRNHYRIWGVEKPNVLFVPGTEIVIDARFSGNLTRFIRRSCNPNCELVPVKVGSNFKFMLNSLKPIKSGSELTVAWNWDNKHPIKLIIEGQPFDATNDADKPTLVLSIESILNFVECACSSSSECYLSKVKKARAYIFRANKKGNTPSISKILKKESLHTPVETRFDVERQLDLAESLESSKIIDENTKEERGEEEEIPVQKIITEVHVKPFIYSYATKKRRHLDEIETNEIPESKDYLPVPFMLEKRIEPVIVATTSGEVTEGVPIITSGKPKKLSFADYYKKRKTGPA